MGFFSRMRVASRAYWEKVKDRLQDTDLMDDTCAELQALGIDAQKAECGRPEEKIGVEGNQNLDRFCLNGISLGLIDIPEGPIRWVNIRSEPSESGIIYYTNYGVPNPRLGPASPEMHIYSVRKKNFPLVGKVVDLHWKGRGWYYTPAPVKNQGLRIIDRLKSDILIKHPLIKESYDVKIHASRDHGCWIISTETRGPVSEDLWNCYQAIARHLLAEWPPSR